MIDPAVSCGICIIASPLKPGPRCATVQPAGDYLDEPCCATSHWEVRKSRRWHGLQELRVEAGQQGRQSRQVGIVLEVFQRRGERSHRGLLQLPEAGNGQLGEPVLGLAIAADDPPGGGAGRSSAVTDGRPSAARASARSASCTARGATRDDARIRNDRGTNSLRPTASTASAAPAPRGASENRGQLIE